MLAWPDRKSVNRPKRKIRLPRQGASSASADGNRQRWRERHRLRTDGTDRTERTSRVQHQNNSGRKLERGNLQRRDGGR